MQHSRLYLLRKPSYSYFCVNVSKFSLPNRRRSQVSFSVGIRFSDHDFQKRVGYFGNQKSALCDCVGCDRNFSRTLLEILTSAHTQWKYGQKSTRTSSNRLICHQIEAKTMQRWAVSAFMIFTARCTLVQSAVLRSHIVCPSVCPSVRLSVCLSVTFRYRDHIGWNSWKLTAGTISPAPLLFGAQRISTYSQGNMGKFWGD